MTVPSPTSMPECQNPTSPSSPLRPRHTIRWSPRAMAAVTTTEAGGAEGVGAIKGGGGGGERKGEGVGQRRERASWRQGGRRALERTDTGQGAPNRRTPGGGHASEEGTKKKNKAKKRKQGWHRSSSLPLLPGGTRAATAGRRASRRAAGRPGGRPNGGRASAAAGRGGAHRPSRPGTRRPRGAEGGERRAEAAPAHGEEGALWHAGGG